MYVGLLYLQHRITYNIKVFGNPQLFSSEMNNSITPNPKRALKLEQIAVALPFTAGGNTSAITAHVTDPEPIIIIIYTCNY